VAWLAHSLAIVLAVMATSSLRPASSGSVVAMLAVGIGYSGGPGLLVWIVRQLDVGWSTRCGLVNLAGSY
jgi:hypothetical protein